MLLQALLLVALGTTTLSSNATSDSALHLLVMAPFPDQESPPAFSGGHSLIPAVLLAMDHINRSPDILPNHTLKAVVGSSGCEQLQRTALSFVPNVSGKQPVAVIGPACSEASVFVADLCNNTRLDLVQAAVGTTTELDAHEHKYPNTFGMVSSDGIYAKVLLDLAECNNWDSVSIIYESRPYFLETLRVITDILSRQNINVSFAGNIVTSPLNIPLLRASRERNHTRIIVVLASIGPAQSVACMASALGFTFPNYQFVFINRILNEFLTETDYTISIGMGENYLCSAQNIRNGLEGSVLLRYALRNSDESARTISGRTVSEVAEEYIRKVRGMCSEDSNTNENALYYSIAETSTVPYRNFTDAYCSSTSQNERAQENIFAYPYYDATWAIALSLHNILTTETNFSLNELTPLLLNEMHQVKFQGVSTFVKFNSNTGHVSNSVDIFQISKSNVIKFTTHNGSRLTCTVDLQALFINNTFPVRYETISIYSIVLGVIFLILSLALTVALHILHIKYRKHHSVKARSPLLNQFIFLGCYIFIFNILLDTIASTILSNSEKGNCIICNIVFFLHSLGFDMIYGALCVKLWRLYNIFMQPFKRQRLLSNSVLVLYVVIIILICILLHLWMLVYYITATSIDTDVVESEQGYIQVRRIVCQFQSIGYIFIPGVYHLSLTVATLTLCILNRNISLNDFRNSRGTIVLSYLLALVWIIGGTTLLVYIRYSKDITYLIYTVASTVTVFLCHLLLIIPVTLRAIITYHPNILHYLTHLPSIQCYKCYTHHHCAPKVSC